MDKPTRPECCPTCGAMEIGMKRELSVAFACDAIYDLNVSKGWIIDEQCRHATEKAAEFRGLAERMLRTLTERHGLVNPEWVLKCSDCTLINEARLALGLEEKNEHS